MKHFDNVPHRLENWWGNLWNCLYNIRKFWLISWNGLNFINLLRGSENDLLKDEACWWVIWAGWGEIFPTFPSLIVGNIRFGRLQCTYVYYDLFSRVRNVWIRMSFSLKLNYPPSIYSQKIRRSACREGLQFDVIVPSYLHVVYFALMILMY